VYVSLIIKAKDCAAMRAAEKGVITPVSTSETQPITPLSATVRKEFLPVKVLP
jgi:hypothetical protein